MPSMRKSLVSCFFLLLTLLSSCNDQRDDGLLTGVKTELDIPHGQYILRVSYDPPVGDKYFTINCKRPNDQGVLGAIDIPISRQGYTLVTLPLPQKPDQYTITCRDNAGNKAEDSFSTKGEVVVEKDVAIEPAQSGEAGAPAGTPYPLAGRAGTYRSVEFSPASKSFQSWVSQLDFPSPELTGGKMLLSFDTQGNVTGGSFYLELAQAVDKSTLPDACVKFRLNMVSTAVKGSLTADGNSGQAVFTSSKTTELTAKTLETYGTCNQPAPETVDYPKVVFFFQADHSMAACVEGEDDTTREACLANPLAILTP